MPTLPEPHFIDRDPEAILRECIVRFEELVQRPLIPSQAERLMIDLIVYRETLVRIAVQDACKQNLIAFALYPMIDYLSQLVGDERLPVKSARVTIEWFVDEPVEDDELIAAGTRCQTNDGKFQFAALEDRTIVSGSSSTPSVVAECTTPGPLANGYAPGQITKVVDGFEIDLKVESLTPTDGGAAQEDTERLRERLPLAIKGASAAGPEDAYARIALKAHQNVLDVYVDSPEGGVVRLYILSTTDPEPEELLEIVFDACSAKTVRPLCDTVEVEGTERIGYELECEYRVYPGNDPEVVLDLIEEKLLEYTTLLERRQGRSPIESRMQGITYTVPGLYELNVISELPVIERQQVSRLDGISISFEGYTEEPEP
ncbi:MAG TPA: baseplate J/gp47 family protein [Polyangiaceae bacterium]|nr:baseplate J/gp47 family protein [Polyangiaceae bacterium]